LLLLGKICFIGNAQVYIPGYGFATVADIGGGIPGKRWIDLGYGEEDYQPWSKEVMVYILASSQ
jgi:3D (Asp-Asp-Asp) domain-containing protein